MSIMKVLNELAGRAASMVDVRLKNFPYPPYHNDNFVIVIQTQMPFFVMLSFIVTAPVICKDVVLEKEKKLKVWRHLAFQSINQSISESINRSINQSVKQSVIF